MTSQVEMSVEADDTQVDDTQDGAAPPAEPTAAGGSRGGRGRLVLLLVAALLAVSGSVMWWVSNQDPDRLAAQNRDDVLIQGRQAIETMNTLDYRSVDDGVKAWSQVTTGTFRDQLTQVSAEDQTLLAEQKKISTGRVVDAAVVDVDDTTATVIAAVEVTVQDDASPGSEPTVKRNRFSADLIKDGDGRWKLESLQQVAVSLS